MNIDINLNNDDKISHSYNMNDVVIPKIIFQTWKNKTVPNQWKLSQDNIKKHFPGWKYVFFTDEDNRQFIQKYYPWF